MNGHRLFVGAIETMKRAVERIVVASR